MLEKKKLKWQEIQGKIYEARTREEISDKEMSNFLTLFYKKAITEPDNLDTTYKITT